MRSPIVTITASKATTASKRRSYQVEQLEERLLLATNPLAPLDLGGDPRVDPADFRVTAFATGLNYPVSMQQLSDGSLLVGTAKPTSPETGFYNATVELVRLVDANGDGVADGPGQIVFSGLPGAATAVREAGDLLFVASTRFSGPERLISVLRAGATPGDPYTLIGHIAFAPRSGSIHETKTLAVRNTPGQPGSFDLVFGVGAITNDTATTDPVTVSGLITASINADSIYMVTVDNTGATPEFSDLMQIAAGVRNTAGILFHPATGDLYFADNNFNDPNNPGEPISTDELNTIAAADIGGAIENFGHPFDYIEYRTGTRVGSGGVQPLVAFQPVSSVEPIQESEGPSEIAFAPANFPPGLNNGIFVTFHGEGAAGTLNRENPVVYVDLGTGEYFHFISVESAGVGHLDGVLSTADSLFLADISSNGELRDASGKGVIYQIRALPDIDKHTVGGYDPVRGMFYLKSENTAGPAEVDFRFGPTNTDWVPLAGDWDGDGTSSVGLFDPSSNNFWLRNTHQSGPADVAFRFGPTGAGWLPIVGDWDNDGDDSVGLYDPVSGLFWLNFENGPGSADLVYRYGPKHANWLPIAGDWNGDGTDTVGLYNPSSGTFYLRNWHAAGVADTTFRYGPTGTNWLPLSGDWNGDGIDTVGLYDPAAGKYFLTDTHTPGPADTVVRYGPVGNGWKPIMGDWGMYFVTQSSNDASGVLAAEAGNPVAAGATSSFGLLAASATSDDPVEEPANPNDPLSSHGTSPSSSDSGGDDPMPGADVDVSDATAVDSDSPDPVLDLALVELADELAL